MLDARGRRHVRPDGLVLGHGPPDGGDLLVVVVRRLLFVRVIRAVLEVRVGNGLRVMVHRVPPGRGRRRRVDVARRRQRGPERLRRYVDRVVQRRALLRLGAEVRLVPPLFLTTVTGRACDWFIQLLLQRPIHMPAWRIGIYGIASCYVTQATYAR